MFVENNEQICYGSSFLCKYDLKKFINLNSIFSDSACYHIILNVGIMGQIKNPWKSPWTAKYFAIWTYPTLF